MTTTEQPVPLRDLPAWSARERHHGEVRDCLRELFAADPGRGDA